MKFFLDTGNLEEIRRVNRLGLVDGVTTNPSIIAREKRPFKDIILDICKEVKGPVSAEVIGVRAGDMIREAHELARWADNIVIKLPMTEDGLEATYKLSKDGIKTNVTLVFTVAQKLMAAKAGATYVSPFVGRLDDIGIEGMNLFRALRTVLENYRFPTEIITASVRSIEHVQEAALAGAHIATIPGSLFPCCGDIRLRRSASSGSSRIGNRFRAGCQAVPGTGLPQILRRDAAGFKARQASNNGIAVRITGHILAMMTFTPRSRI